MILAWCDKCQKNTLMHSKPLWYEAQCAECGTWTIIIRDEED